MIDDSLPCCSMRLVNVHASDRPSNGDWGIGVCSLTGGDGGAEALRMVEDEDLGRTSTMCSR